MKAIKRPVVVDVVQWTEQFVSLLEDAPEWVRDAYEKGIITIGEKILIHTLEGNMEISMNDWLIKGVNGELYPCKPDIFEKTYAIKE